MPTTSADITGSNADPSITWDTWNTTNKKTYDSLELVVTVDSSGFSDDTWSIYFDNSTDTSCDSTDRVLKASGSENLGAITNYSATLPAGQTLGNLLKKLRKVKLANCWIY